VSLQRERRYITFSVVAINKFDHEQCCTIITLRDTGAQ
jgi:hypothetical protein